LPRYVRAVNMLAGVRNPQYAANGKFLELP
jgi:hypothetical protein